MYSVTKANMYKIKADRTRYHWTDLLDLLSSSNTSASQAPQDFQCDQGDQDYQVD